MTLRRFTYRAGNYPDEPAHALVHRRAYVARMGTIKRAWRFVGASPDALRLGQGIDTVADVCGADVDHLAHVTFRELGGRKVRIFGHELPFEGVVRQFRRWCPDCFAAEPYHRASWDLAALTHCVEHSRPLETECPSCREPQGWDRLDLLRCRCGASLTRAACETVDEDAFGFDVWLTGRIDGGTGGPGLMDDMPLSQAVALCERLGCHALDPWGIFHDTWRRVGAAKALNEGFRVAAGGPDALRELMDRLLAAGRDGAAAQEVQHKGGGGWGLTHAYGPFATWLIRRGGEAAYKTVTKVAAEHAVDNVVLKSGARVFGHKVGPTELGVGIMDLGARTMVGHMRLRRIARSLGHLPRDLHQGRPARLPREVAGEIRTRLADSVDLSGAADLLGIGVALAGKLVKAGLLPTYVAGNQDRVGAYVIERSAVADLIRSLEPADDVSAPADALPLPTVSPATYVSVAQAIRWILDGSLAVVGVDPAEIGLRRLLLRASDLVHARQRDSFGGLSVNEVAKRLGTNWQVVQQLVDQGYLGACEAAGARWIDEDELGAFQRRFVKGSDAAVLIGTGRRWTERVLGREGVFPIIGRDVCRLTFFDRAQVERAVATMERNGLGGGRVEQ